MRVRAAGTMLFFDVDGELLEPAGLELREKPTLLLLHGGPGSDHSVYKPFFSRLTDLCQVVYLDQRGNGRSERGDPRDWTLDRWAADVPALCEALGIDRPVVLGTSFGASVAMHYAARHPEHPRALVLISGSPLKRIDRSLAVYERLGGAEAREAARRWNEAPGPETGAAMLRLCAPLYFRSPQPAEWAERPLRNFDLALHWEGGRERFRDLRPGLADVRCPVLVMGGEDDPQTPIQDQADLAAALPDGLVRFERFAECGHGVFPDRPEEALRVLREFIGSLEPEPTPERPA